MEERFLNRLDELPLDDNLRRYFSSIIKEVLLEYDLASKVRGRGPDIHPYPESVLVWDMAERVEKLLDLPGVAEFIRSNKRLSREELALKAIDELIEGRFGVYDLPKLVDLGVRLPLAILTEGMTVAPIEGIKKVEIKMGKLGEYLSIYYAGPIRSAGGTETGLSVIYADYLRRRLNIGRYFPSKLEIYRFIEEIRIYERRVGRFQYSHTDEVLYFILSNLPVEVTGIATDNEEVLSYRDIPSIETNKLRGGALRVVNDGIGGKAKKLVKILDELGIEGWEWLKEIISDNGGSAANSKKSSGDKVLSDLVMGRPVFSLQRSNKGLRLRYARVSNIGISAVGLHPATFALLDYFIVTGSQLKLNLPGKGGIAVPTTIASPPIVELDDDSIVELQSEEEVSQLKDRIKRILFLGDIVISYGDFLENNHPIVPSHYSPEWWAAEVSDKLGESLPVSDVYSLSYEESMRISRKLGIPMNPLYVPSFEWLSLDEAESLLRLLSNNLIEGSGVNVVLKYDKTLHQLMKKSKIPLKRDDDKIVVKHRYGYILNDLISGYRNQVFKPPKFSDVSDLISFYLGVKVRLLRGTYVSARLGRPEKAKKREMNPPTHVLFPIGNYGGQERDIIRALNEVKGTLALELSILKCPKCEIYTYRNQCEYCGSRTTQAYYCRSCKVETESKTCSKCGNKTFPYRIWPVDLSKLYKELVERYRLPTVKKLKGVRGLINENKRYEDLSKGILRARYGLSIFRDGTCRVDITNAPLDKVRIKDIGLTVERAKALGYNVDSEEDVIDLYPMDIVVPEPIANYLVDVCNFLDAELTKIYRTRKFYNVKRKEDLIGKLVVGISPHTSSGVIGRIIGFTKAQVLYAHPLWHAAKRRDCDGDQDTIMLLLDVFLNFSREYLPSSSGGRMDAPLFISVIIHPDEVDTQVHNLDIVSSYPLELFKGSQESVSPKAVKRHITTVEDVLGSSRSYYRYDSFSEYPILDLSVNTNRYSKLNSMDSKLSSQLKVMEKIFTVDEKALIIESLLKNHIIRDIMGNLRSFLQQKFQCKQCSRKYRRIPLSDKCPYCAGELKLTVSVKAVTKYLGHARRLTRYVKSDYVKSYIALIESIIDSTFGGEDGKGESLSAFLWGSSTRQDKTDQ